MKISFITELQNKIRSDCDICGRETVLEYLVMDENAAMYAICRECSEDIVKHNYRAED